MEKTKVFPGLLDTESSTIRGWRLLHNAGKFAREMALVGESAMVTDVDEAAGGAHDEVAGFLNAKVAQVLLGSHVEAGFKLSQKAAQGKVGRTWRGC